MTSANHNPDNFVRVFSQYVWAIIQFLIWSILGFAGIAATYVAVRIVLVVVKAIFNALGI
jgi:hypothetical protein